MLSTIKGSLNVFLFLLTIMKEISKGVDGRTVKDLETPQLNCFGQNGSLWWRRNPLPSKGVAGTEAPRPRQVGYRTSSTPQFLTGLASSHTVRSNSQHFRATCLRPQTVRRTKKKKHARSGIQRCNTQGTGRVDNTAPDFSKGNHKP